MHSIDHSNKIFEMLRGDLPGVGLFGAGVVHTLQLFLQNTSIKFGFLSHSPVDAQ